MGVGPGRRPRGLSLTPFRLRQRRTGARSGCATPLSCRHTLGSSSATRRPHAVRKRARRAAHIRGLADIPYTRRSNTIARVIDAAVRCASALASAAALPSRNSENRGQSDIRPPPARPAPRTRRCGCAAATTPLRAAHRCGARVRVRARPQSARAARQSRRRPAQRRSSSKA